MPMSTQLEAQKFKFQKLHFNAQRAVMCSIGKEKSNNNNRFQVYLLAVKFS